jgi:hypothetical protein
VTQPSRPGDPLAAPAGGDASARRDRAELLVKAAVAGGALAGGAAALVLLPRLAGSAPSPEGDVRGLNLLLEIEELQVAFYENVLATGAATGGLLEFVRTAAEQDAKHVATLREILGGDARPAPRFDFGQVNEQGWRVAARIEDLAIAAHAAQMPGLSRDALIQTLGMVSVDARHASWVRAVGGVRAPRAGASDGAMDDRQLREAITALGVSVGSGG